MKSVFFYGLFMDKDFLIEKGCQPEYCALALVEGYELQIGERATLVKSAKKQAYGLITDLSEQDLSRLYSEPSVADYQPESFLVCDLKGNPRKVVSYILPIELLSGKNPKYAKSLAIIAAKLELPQTYINEIISWTK